MKKLFILILSVFLVCGCFAEDNNTTYDAFVEAMAKTYILGSKVASSVGNKAKDINEKYEISDNIDKFIKDQKLDKKLKKFNKSIDDFSKDLKKQIKKESAKNK